MAQSRPTHPEMAPHYGTHEWRQPATQQSTESDSRRDEHTGFITSHLALTKSFVKSTQQFSTFSLLKCDGLSISLPGRLLGGFELEAWTFRWDLATLAFVACSNENLLELLVEVVPTLLDFISSARDKLSGPVFFPKLSTYCIPIIKRHVPRPRKIKSFYKCWHIKALSPNRELQHDVVTPICFIKLDTFRAKTHQSMQREPFHVVLFGSPFASRGKCIKGKRRWTSSSSGVRFQSPIAIQLVYLARACKCATNMSAKMPQVAVARLHFYSDNLALKGWSSTPLSEIWSYCEQQLQWEQSLHCQENRHCSLAHSRHLQTTLTLLCSSWLLAR